MGTPKSGDYLVIWGVYEDYMRVLCRYIYIHIYIESYYMARA